MSAEFEQQWLDGLPANWGEKRADFLCNPYRVTVDPSDFGDDLVAHYSIPQVQETGGPIIEPASDIDSAKLLITAPTLLVSKLNPRKQTICIAEPHDEHVTLASGEFVAINSDAIDRKYAYYLWCSEKVTDRLSAMVQSATRSHQRINPADILKLPWKWPPVETQKRIARFLDEKTARIDGLIETKRALLERLAEKREALITRAVTKGLDPTAPMKPSGIGWLGDIPAHWEVKQLRRVRSYLTSGSRDWAAYYADQGEPFLRMTNVTGRGIELDLADLRYVDLGGVTEGTRTSVREGDILITITAELGAVAIVRQNIEGAYINQHLALFRPNPKLCAPDFLVNFLSTDLTRAQFTVSGQGGTKQGLGFEQVNNVTIGFPPRVEQESIGNFCNEVWQQFDLAERALSSSIDRLIEYRAALITAAVTGNVGGLQ
jgi:type I restriction enzyme S subunit